MISSVNSINSNLGIVPSLDSKELTETSIDSATDLYQELDSRNIRVKRFIRDDYGVVVSKVDGEFLSDSLVRCSSVFMNFKCVTGKNSTVEGCGAVKHEFYRCNNRLCPRCSDVIGSRFMRKYRSFVEGMVNPKFMTLTLRNVDSIDRDYFSQLSRYWSAFKKRLFRDNYVLNKGLYVKEVTEKGSGFHVHLHVIYEGSYLPQKYISDQWSKVTTGSMVVDIRPVRHKFKDMGYLLKIGRAHV